MVFLTKKYVKFFEEFNHKSTPTVIYTRETKMLLIEQNEIASLME